MKKPFQQILIPVAILIAIVLVIGYQNNVFGIPDGGRLESFSRRNQPIPEDWLCIQTQEKDVAALLFYPKEMDNAIYSIYLKGSGLSFGFSARSRGFMNFIQTDICEFHHGEREVSILLSLNAPNITRVEVHNGDKSQTITLDPEEPFVLILPLDADIQLFDAQGVEHKQERKVVPI